MKTAEARTRSKFDRSTCKRCGGYIYRDDPVFLWDETWVCEGCNNKLISVDESGGSTDWIVACFNEVPEAYRDKVFKALSLAFHPDHGGDPVVMRRLLEVRARA